jgi:hypothetical protein
VFYLSAKVCEKAKSAEMRSFSWATKIVFGEHSGITSESSEKKEMPDLITQLTELKQIYDQVEIKYASISEPGIKRMEPILVSDEALAKISEKITEIRNGIIL